MRLAIGVLVSVTTRKCVVWNSELTLNWNVPSLFAVFRAGEGVGEGASAADQESSCDRPGRQ